MFFPPAEIRRLQRPWKLGKLPLIILCLAAGTASAETWATHPATPGFSDAGSLFSSSSARIEKIQPPSGQPVGQTFSLGLGPKILEFKTLYLERNEENNSAPAGAPRQRYVDVLATSSQFDGKLVGEGELAYSTLGFSTTSQEPPTMLRLGLKARWQQLSYGADYRSIERGFTLMTGARFDNGRDESQIWGEYSFGWLRVRGSLGELWEKTADDQLVLSRTAATSFNFDKAAWSGTWVSSYSLVGQGTGDDRETVVFTNALTASYRPMSFLSIEPHLSFKEELDQRTGSRTETPAVSLAIVCAPLKDFYLSGRASYARSLTRYGLNDSSTANSAAALSWKIGKSAASERFLSFQIDYQNQLYFNSPAASQENLAATVQLKILGF
jgi:hypothetical protein